MAPSLSCPLWYYLILSQDEMWVELHSKTEDGSWETQYFTEPDELIHLPHFGLSIQLSDIYKRTPHLLLTAGPLFPDGRKGAQPEQLRFFRRLPPPVQQG